MTSPVDDAGDRAAVREEDPPPAEGRGAGGNGERATAAPVAEPTDPHALGPATLVDDDGAPATEVEAGAEAPAPAERPVPAVDRPASWFRTVARRHALPVVVVAVVGVVAMINHFSGHDWGDDFSLYMRQAKALTIGNIGEVAADNRFNVDNSGWHTFSPYTYPWGWPLLVSPFYAVVGLDYDFFKFLEVVALCGFLLAFFALVRKRAGLVPATVLILLIGLSPMYIGYTDTVLSDIPYLCFVGLTLWWLDRCRERGLLSGDRRQLVILGLLLAFTYNVRREGIILLASLMAVHVATLGALVVRARGVDGLRRVRWKEVALPYGTFAAAVAGFHLLLPTVLFPSAPGTGLQNVSARITYYRDILAQQIGLQDPGGPIHLLHNETAGRRVLVLLVVLGTVGVFGRLLLHFQEDISLAAYGASAGLLMLVSPYQEPRYLLTITPFLAYFAYQALPTLVEGATYSPRLFRATSLAAGLALTGLVFLNVQDVVRSTRYHLDYAYVQHGPETVDAQEMFGVVKEKTRGDDVILFFRARAMTLYTDRRSVMGTNLDQLLPRSDWYVMAKNSTYSQTLLTDEQAAAYGLEKYWENSGWVMWRVTPRLAL